MPHDKNGTLLEIGDVIKAPAMNRGNPANMEVGRILQTSESQTCTGRFAFIAYEGILTDYFNANDAELVMKHGERKKA